MGLVILLQSTIKGRLNCSGLTFRELSAKHKQFKTSVKNIVTPLVDQVLIT